MDVYNFYFFVKKQPQIETEKKNGIMVKIEIEL